MLEKTKTVLSWFGIRLVVTQDPQSTPRSHDGRPQPPHHLEPNGKPRSYKS